MVSIFDDNLESEKYQVFEFIGQPEKYESTNIYCVLLLVLLCYFFSFALFAPDSDKHQVERRVAISCLQIKLGPLLLCMCAFRFYLDIFSDLQNTILKLFVQ